MKPITISQGHMARPAMALRPGPYGPVPAAPVLALGAVGAVPPGVGVVEGGEIPYKPEALAIKKENQQDWFNRIRRSSATCRVCRAPPTCRIRSRSSQSASAMTLRL